MRPENDDTFEAIKPGWLKIGIETELYERYYSFIKLL